MEKEALTQFEGKKVKLHYHSDFSLKGIIRKVYTDTILFETKQAQSLICIKDIRSVTELRE
jgi:hypothetical protein